MIEIQTKALQTSVLKRFKNKSWQKKKLTEKTNMSHREEPQLNGSGLLFDLSVADISLNSMNTSLEIREIINDYNDTLKTATEEIKTLNRFDLFLKK